MTNSLGNHQHVCGVAAIATANILKRIGYLLLVIGYFSFFFGWSTHIGFRSRHRIVLLSDHPRYWDSRACGSRQIIPGNGAQRDQPRSACGGTAAGDDNGFGFCLAETAQCCGGRSSADMSFYFGDSHQNTRSDKLGLRCFVASAFLK